MATNPLYPEQGQTPPPGPPPPPPPGPNGAGPQDTLYPPPATPPTITDQAVGPGVTTAVTPPDPALVQTQLGQLLDSGSSYIKSAEQSGIDYAASRGLQNSSIAAQSGRQAATEAALPIANADAAHFARLNEMEAQGNIESKLQGEMFGYNTQLSEQDYQHQIGIIGAQLANSMQLSAQEQTELLQQLSTQNDYALQQIKASADATLAPQLQADYLIGVTNLMTGANSEIAAIYQTQGLTPEQQQSAVQGVIDRMNINVQTLGDFYASSPEWDPNWGNSGAGGAPSPATPIGNPPPQIPYPPPGPPAPPPPGPGLFPPGFPNNQFNP